MLSDQISFLFLPPSAGGDLVSLTETSGKAPTLRLSRCCFPFAFQHATPGPARSPAEPCRGCVPQLASFLMSRSAERSRGPAHGAVPVRDAEPGARGSEGIWEREGCCWSRDCWDIGTKPARSHCSGNLPCRGFPVRDTGESCRRSERFAIPCSWCWVPLGFFLKMGFPLPGSLVCSVRSTLSPVKPAASSAAGAAAVGQEQCLSCACSLHPFHCPAPLLSPQSTADRPCRGQRQGRAAELGSIASLPVPDPQRMRLPRQVPATWCSNILIKMKVFHKS